MPRIRLVLRITGKIWCIQYLRQVIHSLIGEDDSIPRDKSVAVAGTNFEQPFSPTAVDKYSDAEAKQADRCRDQLISSSYGCKFSEASSE